MADATIIAVKEIVGESPFSAEFQKILENAAAKFISAHYFQPDEDRLAYARDVELLLTRGAGLAVFDILVRNKI